MNKFIKKFFCLAITGTMLFSTAVSAEAATVINGSYVKGDNENNPLVTQNYGADPAVLVYNNRIYVYTTNDSQEYDATHGKNTYGKINQLNCYSSSDMVNWTDHGQINVAGRDGAAKWASNSWAPTICCKKINGRDKFFLYFANNASSIGVLTADSPTGPWRDPLGRAFITKSTPNCNVEWLFDPAVLVDSNGTGYLYFGGGVPAGQAAHPRTARVIKLGGDMISTSGTAAMIDAPYLFEDSGINKIGNTYYYSYCTNWNCSNGYRNATIHVMTSSNPMGPFTHQGEIMANPGEFFSGSTGNNHHQIFEFKGNYYIAYHTMTVQNKVMSNLGYRTTQIDRVNVSNGRIQPIKETMSGVPMNPSVNPYEWVQAETMFTQAGIKVRGNGDGSAWVTDINNGDFTKVKGVQFSKGVKSITATVQSGGNGSIEVREGSQSGTLLGTINVSNTSGSFKDFTANVRNVNGAKDIVFVFRGSFAFDRWKANTDNGGSEAQPTPTPTPTPSQNVDANTTANIADGWYYLKNTLSQKYLTVEGNSAKAATNVCISKGTGVDGQKWYVQNLGNGYISLKSGLGDFMLDVANGKDEDGANLQIYNAYAHDPQQFVVKNTNKSGVYTIATKTSAGTKYIDVYEHKTADGTNVCQWTYYGNPNQQWQFEKVNGGSQAQPTPTPTPAPTAQPTTTPTPAPQPSTESGLTAKATVNSWGSGYTASIKVSNNTGKTVNGWTLKIKKSEVKMDSSWNVNVKESGDSYVLTPVDWNSSIPNGGSVEFGFNGSGNVGSISIDVQ
ncbi:family 43 glycosylhydrolase [Pseudobutyrivibrio xylanivorans]|uniref:Arabinoxylan arabinofuranohydrolase n=1 Tax=Pseudobutyrivibrio xylanivorans TaxID=185007 RepID=A0A1G5S4N5_PSEXY|nr:family 43 glycosylhydrolase [Pseudobutyrivibrio xylanivorans]SCZ80489.1 arabinoxylan arabinofuranohydrolase [Pseudobutyrivibrio xylanivorans]